MLLAANEMGDSMKELLGFVVLTSPLFLVVLWVPVCFFLAVLVGRKFIKRSLPVRIAGGVTVFLVALLLPASDEIAGRIYFNHLCETEAGMRVYQPMELPVEYWDEDGSLKFLKSVKLKGSTQAGRMIKKFHFSQSMNLIRLLEM